MADIPAATTTTAGLKVRCQLDRNTYPAGIKVSDAQMRAINLARHDFHGEWNYTVPMNEVVDKSHLLLVPRRPVAALRASLPSRQPTSYGSTPTYANGGPD